MDTPSLQARWSSSSLVYVYLPGQSHVSYAVLAALLHQYRIMGTVQYLDNGESSLLNTSLDVQAMFA